MRLNKLDVQRVHDNMPEYLRLFNITEYSNWYEAIPQFVKKIFISTTNKDILEQVALQFGKVTKLGDTFIMAERTTLVEIELTTKCNLSCDNCMKLSNYTSTWRDMPFSKVEEFIQDNKHLKLTVKLTGGEPILHPDIDKIITKLSKYFLVILATNGVKEYTPPVHIAIENTSKEVGINPEFYSVFNAPTDEALYAQPLYFLGCDYADVCGTTYTNEGYFPCPMSGVISRTHGLELQSKSLLCNNKHLVFNNVCKLCGLYKHSGFNGTAEEFIRHTDGQRLSESWKFMEGR